MKPDTPFTGPDVCALPAREVVAALRKREISPTEVVAASAQRIADVEPAVNAMPTVCAERAEAKIAELGQGEADHVGWLAGLPIGIKDLNAVEGVRTTWGNLTLKDFVPDASDPMVERLEARGGLVMGKTNTPEFGAGGNSTNPVFGATRNPWDTRMNAGGSSGGAAASLATGEVWLSHGSDLMGSLRTPAAHCSVLGLRPSPGRCGGGPGSAAFLTEGLQGPMARDVRDLALFLDAMTGYDPRMPISLDAPATSFQAELDRQSKPPRIAFSEDQNGFAAVEREIRTVLRGAMEEVMKAGATVEETCPDLPDLNETYLALRGLHYGSVIASLPEPVRAVFGERLSDNVAYAKRLTAQAIYDAMRARTTLYEIMRGFLTRFDVLAIPVVGIAPDLVEHDYPRHVDGAEIGTYEDWLRFSFLATTTLLPALSMPAGFTAGGLPVGLQLVGPPRGEAVLLRTALFIEEALDLGNRPIDPVIRH
ncbi:amidase [Thalassococcus sp. S3]|uniref:amidase n=1 Tax=Thalassococcus sp. S3 TaxID=2017482 RepID=UPI00102482C9|nr:amidase family protein [Thalassococcus sp. S3]QBF30708.1 amidase [Thalassococcus sp. S3]